VIPRLVLTILLCMLPLCLGAATYYYQKPDATTLPDTGRVLLYDPVTNSDKNITGLKLKQEIAAFAHLSSSRTVGTQAGIFGYIAQPGATMTKQAGATDSIYARQLEVKDQTGKIVYWVNASGQMIFGTPLDLSVSSVYPANGATGVAYDGSVIPTVTFNKNTDATISTVYIVGNSTAPISDYGLEWRIPFNLAANTTYVIKVVKNSIVQTDGQTDSTCGAMTTKPDYSCESTFTTAP